VSFVACPAGLALPRTEILMQVAFPTGSSSPRSAAVDSQRGVFRAEEDGEFAQVHQDTQTVRWVTRDVYAEGSLPIRHVTPRLPTPEVHQDGGLDCAADRARVVRLDQWWYELSGVWQTYSDRDNKRLEEAYDPPRRVRVAVRDGEGEADVILMAERSQQGEVLPLLRARWHVQRSDGTFLPFSHIDSANIEQALVLGPFLFVADHYFAAKVLTLRAQAAGVGRCVAAPSAPPPFTPPPSTSHPLQVPPLHTSPFHSASPPE
jgi:hypothetical protein